MIYEGYSNVLKQSGLTKLCAIWHAVSQALSILRPVVWQKDYKKYADMTSFLDLVFFLGTLQIINLRSKTNFQKLHF